MIAVGYVRVSKIEKDQRGVSINAQEKNIRIYCQLNNLTLRNVLKDEGESGKDLKRDGMRQLVQLVEKKSIQAVVVYKLDRLSRKVVDTLNLIEKFERHSVSFHSITEKIDTTTAIGRFFVTVIAAIAQIERDLISERTKAALQFKRSRGDVAGGIPYGYKATGKGKKAKLIKDNEEFQILEEILQSHEDGVSYNMIASQLNSRNVLTRCGGQWYPQTIKSIVVHSRI